MQFPQNVSQPVDTCASQLSSWLVQTSSTVERPVCFTILAGPVCCTTFTWAGNVAANSSASPAQQPLSNRQESQDDTPRLGNGEEDDAAGDGEASPPGRGRPTAPYSPLRLFRVYHHSCRSLNYRARICSVLGNTRRMDNGSGHKGEGDGHDLLLQKQEWVKTQDMLKSKLVLEDDFDWSLPSARSCSDGEHVREKLKYIAGVDISFLKEDPSMACAAVVVLDAITLEVVHEEFDVVRLQVPYIPGFLAFREAPILLGLLEKVKANAQHFYPQLLMVDGNGLLHPRGFGLACHLGVLADIPTIGVGKNLHHVDGLNQSEVRRQLEAKENCNKELISLTGQSGTTWGVAMRSCSSSSKPIYISVGHRISLDSASAIVKFCCKYRVPEPTRQADIRSKLFLQKFQRPRQ